MPSPTLPSDTIVVATDGGCIGNRGADPAGWGWYVDEANHASGHLPASTNNIAELIAIHRAIEMLPDEADLLIRADSQYAMKCLTGKALGGWVDGWMARGWHKASGQPVSNLDVIRPAYEALQAKTGRVVFEWVKGHNGDPLNEAVDRLANTAARNPSVGVLVGPGWTGFPDSAPALPEATPTLEVLLGIDPDDPSHALAEQLVAATSDMLDSLIANRKASGLTLEGVASRMGVSKQAVARIEGGDRDPHLSTLRRYAHAVGSRLEITVIPAAQ
ncbi:helix-turn-helix domain-containing protein (plasmid) [Citricoccus nitrophenolicus]